MPSVRDYVDAAVTVEGELEIPTRAISGRELVQQRIRIRLQTFAGEYILDQSVGMPWIEWKSSKMIDPDAVRAAVVAEVVDTPGIERVTGSSVVFADRALSVTVSALLVEELGDQAGDTEIGLVANFAGGDGVPAPLALLQLIWGP